MTARHRAACDCGFTGTYTSRPKANYALRRHSCTRWQAKAEARARAETREASVDRAPKPCHHKQACHRHGTRACYVLDRCRCPPCAQANAEAETWRTRQKTYGRYTKYVDADQARRHVHTLMGRGMGLKRIVAVSGVAHGTLWKLIYGKRRPDGTQQPSKRILRTTHDRLVTTAPDLANGQIDEAGTVAARRQLQALVALGWTMSELGRRIDVGPGNIGHLAHGDRTMTAATTRTINQLYTQLSNHRPPEASWQEKVCASRARNYAHRRGWLLPLELDLADDPEPDDEPAAVDWVAIERRMAGDKTIRLTQTEATELVHRWTAAGRPLNACARITGLRPWRYLQPDKPAA